MSELVILPCAKETGGLLPVLRRRGIHADYRVYAHHIVPRDPIAALLPREPVGVAQTLANRLQSLVFHPLVKHVAGPPFRSADAAGEGARREVEAVAAEDHFDILLERQAALRPDLNAVDAAPEDLLKVALAAFPNPVAVKIGVLFP